MSSASFAQANLMPEAHVMSDIPAAISSQILTKPIIASKASLRSVISTTGSVTNGGSSYFYPPASSNSFIKSGSTFLNFTLSVVQTGTPTGMTAGFCFAGSPIEDASSLISRIQVSGTSILENVQFYNIVSGMMVLNKTNQNFAQTDYAALAGANLGASTFNLSPTGTSYTSTYNFSIPLLLGLFNSPDSYLPLCLCQGMSILVDWQSNLNQVFYAPSGNPVSSYTISNIFLQYMDIEVDALYVQELRSALMQGGVYSFTSQNLQCVAVSSSSTINQEYGFSSNSMCQVSWCNYTTQTSQSAARAAFFDGTQTIGQVYMDNQPVINSHPQDTTNYQSNVYANNKQAWVSSLWDPSVSRALAPNSLAAANAQGGRVFANLNNSPYVTTNFTASAPMEAYQEAGLVFCGRPVNRVRVELYQNAPAGNTYILFIRDCVYEISGSGMILQRF